jgi:uncharacterized protein (DUF433 family)
MKRATLHRQECLCHKRCLCGTDTIRTLLVYLESGETLEEFLDNFPSVTKEQAIAFLEEAGRALLAEIA